MIFRQILSTDSVRRCIEITQENLYVDIIKGLTSGNSSSSSSSFCAQSSTRCASSLSRKITDDGLPINLEYGIEKQFNAILHSLLKVPGSKKKNTEIYIVKY